MSLELLLLLSILPVAKVVSGEGDSNIFLDPANPARAPSTELDSPRIIFHQTVNCHRNKCFV
jgi:hypothetical protein